MFCAVFSYEVVDRPAFERVYGPDGDWAEFFGAGEGYVATEMMSAGDGRYLITDRWASREAYEAFLAAHREEYHRRSAEAEALYVREERVGMFESSFLAAAATSVALRLLPARFAVCRLPPDAPVPDVFWSVTRTDDELSVICPEHAAPAGATVEPGWRGLQVAGPLDFEVIGVAGALAAPLVAAAISILLVATYDTDYLFVREETLDAATAALEAVGHTVT